MKRKHKNVGLVSLACCMAGLVGAVEYDIKQIANSDLVNRDASVSTTGLATWHAHGSGLPGEGGGSDIFYHYKGVTDIVTKKLTHVYAANTRPQVFEDTIVWQTTRDANDVNRETTWILREVSDELRDSGYPELPAFYANSNLLMARGEEGDFNLVPRGQGSSGPFSNFWQYGSVYIRSEGAKTNRFEYLRDRVDTNKLTAVVTNKVALAGPFQLHRKIDEDNPYAVRKVNAPYTSDASGKERRRTITFNELCRWTIGQDKIEWVTHDQRNDLGPSLSGDVITWQKAKSFPFGWEIMALVGAERFQLSTNFYYDMAPKVHGRDVTWYGWDGNDYEIFHWNADTRHVSQITSNSYDDVSPVIWDGMIAWEGYPTVEAEIYVYEPGRDGAAGSLKLVSNNVADDFNPSIFDGKVVWQGFDGDDFEIYLYDRNANREDAADGGQTLGSMKKLTSNVYDDVNPMIRDGVLTWMGYFDNWDAEIFVWDWDRDTAVQLTNDEFVEDKNPYTAGGYIIWQTDAEDKSEVYLATPKS
jgi:hypothetical protein